MEELTESYYKKELPLVAKMKSVNCTTLIHGKKRIKSSFYFCSCDPDQKDPICEECANSCHRDKVGHYLSNRIQAKEICRCGLKNHNCIDMEASEEKGISYDNNCLFYELTDAIDLKILFNQADDYICLFCYNCCLNEVEMLNYVLVDVDEDTPVHTCMCKHNAHSDIKGTFSMINRIDVNKGEYSYLNNCLIFNAIFKSDKLFRNLYASFEANTKKILEEDSKIEIDSSFIFSNFFRSMVTLNSLSTNQKIIHYYSDRAKSYFSFEFTNRVLSMKMKYFDDNLVRFKNTVLQSFFNIMIVSEMRSFPHIKVADLQLLTPIQRMSVNMICGRNTVFKEKFCSPDENNMVEYLLKLFLANTKYIYNEASYFELIKTITGCLKVLAKYNMFSEDQKFKYLNKIENFFNNTYETNKREAKTFKKRDDQVKKLVLKFHSNIIKTMLIFAVQHNDIEFETGYEVFLTQKMHNLTFLHSANQLSKLITRNLVILICSIQSEIPKKIDGKIYKIVNYANDLLNQLISQEDFYLTGMKNTFDKNLKINLRYLKQGCSKEIAVFQDMLQKRLKSLETAIEKYFDLESDYNAFIYVQTEVVKDIFKALKIKVLVSEIGQRAFSGSENEVDEDLMVLEDNLKAISKAVVLRNLGEAFEGVKTVADSRFKNVIINTNTFFTLIKSFALINKIIVEDILESVEHLMQFLYYMVAEDPFICLLLLTPSSFELLFSLPPCFSTMIFRLIYTCISVVHESGKEIHHSTRIMQLLMKHLENSTTEASVYKNLNIFLKIISILLEKAEDFDTSLFIYETRKMLKVIWKNFNIFKDFKGALIDCQSGEISFSSLSSKKSVSDDLDFISEKIFRANRSDSYFCSLKLAYKIVNYYLHLINVVFDDDAIYNDNNFLIRILEKQEIQKILSLRNLPLSLRREILKFYRMVYIDVSINFEQRHSYRAEFCKSVETDYTNEEGISKVYPFLEKLVKISDIEIFGNLENEILMSECLNFEENVKNEAHSKHFLSYINSALISTMKIYVFKMFCSVANMSGKDFLKEFTLILAYLKFKISALKMINTGKTRPSVLDELSKCEDLYQTLIQPDFVCLDYKEVHATVKDCFEEIEFGEPEKVKLDPRHSVLTKCEQIDEEIHRIAHKNSRHKEEQFLMICLYSYRKNKISLNKSSFVKYLADSNTSFQVSYRHLFIKYIFFMMTVPEFAEINTNLNNYILTLLKSDTQNTQNDTWKIYNEKNTNINLAQLADVFFMKFLAVTFQSFNPSSFEKNNNNYEQTCVLIQIFKFLCEEHNNDFQNTFMNDIKLDTNNTLFGKKTIGFYEFLIHMVLKIILISEWDVSKSYNTNGLSLEIFNYIIDFLIEVIQGTDSANFKNLVKKEENKEDSKEKMMLSTMSIRLEKAVFQKLSYSSNSLMLLMNAIKNIVFNNRNMDDVFYQIKTKLCEFSLAFLEEYSCPFDLKESIISYLNTKNCLLAIKCTLKDIFRKRFLAMSKTEREHTMQYLLKVDSGDGEVRKSGTNNITNLLGENITEKEAKKMLKGSVINEYMYNFFKQLYLEDEEFFESVEFNLANILFKLINISAYEFHKEEALKLLERVETVESKGLLKVYYGLTEQSSSSALFSNNLVFEEESTYDYEFFEDYFVLKLFQEITKTVEIRLDTRSTLRVFFTVHPSIHYLSTNTKEDFTKNVERTNLYTKLSSLVENSEYFKEEIEYNYKLSKNNKIYKFSNNISYYWMTIIFYVLVVLFNCYFILFFDVDDVDEERDSALIVQVLEPHETFIVYFSLVQLILNVVVVIFWSFTKLMLYYRVETKKFVNEKKKSNEDYSVKDLSRFDKLNIFFIRSILLKNEIVLFLSNILICSFVLNFPFLSIFFCIQLVQAIQLTKTLRNVILSITLKKSELLTAWLLLAVISFIYSVIGYFFYQHDFYDHEVAF